MCSFVHFFLRYCLDINWKRDAPITTLGGPMSVIDVTSAVLMLFSDAPLLGSDGEKFASIGRLLIGLLISLSVGTRICFSAAMVATMAVSATNGNRKDLACHQATLVVATALWLAQAVATSGSLALLFVNPAACGAQPVADGQHERDQVRDLPGPRVHQPAHVYQGVVACVPARV